MPAYLEGVGALEVLHDVVVEVKLVIVGVARAQDVVAHAGRRVDVRQRTVERPLDPRYAVPDVVLDFGGRETATQRVSRRIAATAGLALRVVVGPGPVHEQPSVDLHVRPKAPAVYARIEEPELRVLRDDLRGRRD